MSQIFGLKSLLPQGEKGFRGEGEKCQSTRLRGGSTDKPIAQRIRIVEYYPRLTRINPARMVAVPKSRGGGQGSCNRKVPRTVPMGMLNWRKAVR